MIDFLVDNPLFLLFLVSALGYLLGSVRVKGVSLGVAAVLFVGLAFGALDPRMALPGVILDLGLIIFVYTIGLASGAGFFASFRRKGLRDNLFAVLMLLVAAALAAAAWAILDLQAAVAAGLFAGSLTSTPALAGLIETAGRISPAELQAAAQAEPVIGYSIAYPAGVLVMLITLFVTQRLFGIDYFQEAKQLRDYDAVEREIVLRTAQVTQPAAVGLTARDLRQRFGMDLIFTRLQRNGEQRLMTGDTTLEMGDLLNVVGIPETVAAVVEFLGVESENQLGLDRSEYDFRRVFVSNQEIAGRSLADLRLPQDFGALVTRVRHGDIDLLARGDTVLELGDRARVVAHRDDLPALSRFFGDSYKALSEVNLLSLNLGLILGLLLGAVPIPLPNGIVIRLGFAGGPLIAGLVLGALRRTGPVVWTIPYSANLTLRQIGLIMLLAAIGVRSGYTFVTTFAESGGLSLFAAAAVMTMVTGFLTLVIGYKLLKIPFGLLVGMVAGLQTQPAVLGFALEQADNELPNIGYALVFPVATITKIIVAQLLLLSLNS
jgi:putative transport protein